MEPLILDGKTLSKVIRKEVKQTISELPYEPTLAVVMVGEDPASAVYVRGKERDCKRVGIRSLKHTLPETATQKEVQSLLLDLNKNPEVDGILLQLPLPKHLDETALVRTISPEKDVDGFLPVNQGLVVLNEESALTPCTPAGIMELLKRHNITIAGREAVVIGRSMTVGKPIAMLLLNAHATCTVCHSKTASLQSHVARADLLVVAAGRRGVIDESWIKEGAVVVDVGIHRLEDGSLGGDLHFEAAAKRAAAITPVPGGVGPMTRTCLLLNTLKAARRRRTV